MFDTIIAGARLVGHEHETRADVAIEAGRISALLRPGEAASARETIDVAGCWLMPGLVDAHAHLREPGLAHKETFESGTKAAALGGVTTILDMPTDDPWTASAADLAAKMALAAGRLHVDIGFQAVLSRDADLEALLDLAPVSVEVFTADVPPRFRFETLDELARALHALGGRDTLAGVSPGDESLLMGSLARNQAGDIAAFLDSRPPLAEAGGIARALVAAAASRARIHVRQINSALGVSTWRRLRNLADTTVETTAQNLFFTADDYLRDGPALKASPPFRGRDDVAALRQALRDGTIDMVATDHAPHTRQEKQAHRNFADIPGGMPGLQTLLPVMGKLVDEGAIARTDLVRLCARNPAMRFDLGRRKGTIAPGYDADILVIDPRRETRIDGREQASLAGYTPFEGWTSSGRLTRVFLRGREIVREGVLVECHRGAVVRREQE